MRSDDRTASARDGDPRLTRMAPQLLRNSIWLASTLGLAFVASEVAVRVLDLGADVRRPPHAGASAGLADDEEARRNDLGRQIHPYLGWSRRPRPSDGGEADGASAPAALARRHTRVNALGFESRIEDYRALSERDYVVGVFGGSVASQLATIAGDELAAALEGRFPSLAGRVAIANLASAGYKQPQQAIALVEAIELGIPLDLVLNVDGFNEVHLGARDARAGHHPFFPSRSHYSAAVALGGVAPSQDELLHAGRAIDARRRAEAVRHFVATSAWARSALVRWIAGLRQRALLERAVAEEMRVEALAAKGAGGARVAQLPIDCGADDPRCGDVLVDLWVRGSRMMAALSRAAGADYVHVLQPNQYVPGSKPLDAQERANAYREGGLQQNVAWGYPLLFDAIPRIEAGGIEFHDLTRIFVDRQEPIYVDVCCHYNRAGNVVLARSIVEQLRIDPGGR